MYTEHFGLTEKPFSISPDPRYLYLSQRHADALAHLIYGISESGGFIQLTGEVGTGKTTLIRSLLEQLPEKTEIALVLNPPLTTHEFLMSICQELRIDADAGLSVKALIDRLNEYLLKAHADDTRVVLIVDEAQTLNPALLEQVRLLTNLETSKRKLLQIILIGQPELRDLLDKPEMRQIAQRITGRYHLEPLSPADARVYVRHRLRVAGAHQDIFTERAIRELFRRAGGIPRLINVLADRSLLAAYTRDERRIGVRLVRQAAGEVFGRSVSPTGRWAWIGVGAMAIGASAVVAGFLVGAFDVAERSSIGRDPAAVPAETLAAVSATAPDPGREAAGNPLPGLLAAAAAPAAAPPDALEDVLIAEAAGADRSGGTAAAALFRLWGVDFSPASGLAPCEHAAAVGLSCLTLAAPSLADLRQIDRPAVLELADETGGRYTVLLRALSRDTAELKVGDRIVTVGIADLIHAWYGEHWLLWRPETGLTPLLQRGMRSERVTWLRDTLAAIRSEAPAIAPGTDATLFDPELERWVREFQASRHLNVDGVVGAQTQIMLQAEVGHRTGPTLAGDD